MKKIVIVCGLIAGLIVSAMMVISSAICYSTGEYKGSMLIGYATMLIAFSLIFVGIKNYRDKHNHGLITFGKAFKIGLLISLIGSTMYVVSWMVESHFFIPDFIDRYTAHVLSEAKASGASESTINKQANEMAIYKDMYKNPALKALLTYAEILPMGLIVTLISALLLKRNAKVQMA